MKIVYSGRAIADLELIASYYRTLADPNISRAVELRLHRVIDRIARHPTALRALRNGRRCASPMSCVIPTIFSIACAARRSKFYTSAILRGGHGGATNRYKCGLSRQLTRCLGVRSFRKSTAVSETGAGHPTARGLSH